MKNDETRLWIKRIEEYKSSGLSALKWAEMNNISVHALRNRVRKYNKENNEISEKVKWTSVVPEKKSLAKVPSESLKVTLGNAVIEVNPGFDHDTLKSLIGILSQC